MRCIYTTLLFFSICLYAIGQKKSLQEIPHLQQQGNTTQLIVSGKPYLTLGAELGNSSASNLDYMQSIGHKLTAMHVNTIVIPIYGELRKPQEDKFDFTLVFSPFSIESTDKPNGAQSHQGQPLRFQLVDMVYNT
ncbi:hypothetical protein QNI16_03205 [Cytophagaceae bacterium YF14B1]|uniref:Uncharacterized protein n=1 Tax=Xanthocytophaga flava TaxID=3048013 RepID=A0AAE3U5F3_9BACT|nr:hypothetical protein [Xanthocytophaga flavus]MDJ1479477.1 hypothetical protein [Xanthocytophaga flavus]